MLECENGLWELRLEILGALSSWMPFITLTKLVELWFAEFVSLDDIIIKKSSLRTTKLGYLLIPTFNFLSWISNTFLKFFFVRTI